MKLYKTLFALMLVFALALTGCQAIGGVDVNKALVNGMNLTSYKGNAVLDVKFEFDPKARVTLQEKDAIESLAALNGLKLNITDMKVENAATSSLKGEIVVPRGKIPFHLYSKDDQTLMNIDGAKAPIILDNSGLGMPMELSSLQDQLAGTDPAKEQELNNALMNFFVSYMNNPSKINVSKVNETIQSETVALTKIQVEMNGSEMKKLLKGTLDSIVEDEAGLKTFVGQMYDLMFAGQELDGLLANRQLAINFLMGPIQATLQEYSLSLDGDSNDFFSANTKFVVDYYVDSNLQPRKLDLNLELAPTDMKGVKKIQFGLAVQLWDLNVEVKADPIAASANALRYDAAEGANLLGHLNKNSVFYQFLKEDMHIDRKRVVLVMDESKPDPTNTMPYTKNGRTMVPVRFVSEQLDGVVKWDSKKQQVTVTNKEQTITIILTIGSTTAYVNGKAVTLDVAAELKGGNRTFVPARFIAENLGADVQWDQGTKSVIITRE